MTPSQQRSLAEKLSAEAQAKVKKETFELGWCVHCGEGVTNFCRSKCANFRCPKELPTVPQRKTP